MSLLETNISGTVESTRLPSTSDETAWKRKWSRVVALVITSTQNVRFGVYQLRVGDVRRHERRQAYRLEWVPPIGDREVDDRFADDDEHPLHQVGADDTVGVLELPLRHLDERGRMAERPEFALVDDLDVVIAALRRKVHPLGEVELLGLGLNEQRLCCL